MVAHLEEVELSNVAREKPDSHFRVRRVLSAILLALTVILVPLAITLSTTGGLTTNSDRFTSTFKDVARNPDVQRIASEKVGNALAATLQQHDPTAAIEAYVAKADAPPAVQAGVGAIVAYAMHGVETALRDNVDRFFASDQFAVLWERSLNTVHRAVVGVVQQVSSTTLLRLDTDGSLWLQAAPINAALQKYLGAHVPQLASLVPEDAISDVLLTKNPALVQVQETARSLPFLLALPWILIAVLGTVGILLARRRLATVALTTAITAGVLVILAAVVGWWNIDTQADAGQVIASFAEPIRAQLVAAFLLTAALCALASGIIYALPRVQSWRRAHAPVNH